MGSRDPENVALCRDLVLQVKPAVTFRYDAGASLAMLGTMYGCGEEWLRERFAEWGVHRRSAHEIADARVTGGVLPSWNEPIPLILRGRTALPPPNSAPVRHEPNPSGSRRTGAVPSLRRQPAAL
ncbi:hypothetical protein [Streptomyces melanogenes]|uniref:hypothetical protein n=1 Tax=Streptomyces melanogenes TaxID=67326 RepID=UPI0037BB9BAB